MNNTVQNQVKAVIRSVVPYLESSAAAAIAHFGFHVSATVSALVIAAGGTGLSIVLHAAETKFKWVGVLLGWVGMPAYTPSVKTLLQQSLDAANAEIASLKAAPAPKVEIPLVSAAAPETTPTPEPSPAAPSA